MRLKAEGRKGHQTEYAWKIYYSSFHSIFHYPHITPIYPQYIPNISYSSFHFLFHYPNIEQPCAGRQAPLRRHLTPRRDSELQKRGLLVTSSAYFLHRHKCVLNQDGRRREGRGSLCRGSAPAQEAFENWLISRYIAGSATSCRA